MITQFQHSSREYCIRGIPRRLTRRRTERGEREIRQSFLTVEREFGRRERAAQIRDGGELYDEESKQEIGLTEFKAADLGRQRQQEKRAAGAEVERLHPDAPRRAQPGPQVTSCDGVERSRDGTSPVAHGTVRGTNTR